MISLSILKSSLFKESFFLMLSSLISSLSKFLVIVILARYFTPELYGVWVAIVSMSAISLLGDLGISNALRNKIAFLIADKSDNDETQREYFFSVFYFLLLLSVLLCVGLHIAVSFLPLEMLFNTDSVYIKEQAVEIFLFVQTVILMSIPFGIVFPIFFSYNESKYIVFFNIISNLIILFLVIVLILIFNVEIVLLAKIYFSLNILFNMTFFVLFLKKRNWHLNVFIDFYHIPKNIKELFMTGILFFGIQFSNASMLNMPTIFLAAVVDLKVAAAYNIVQKLFAFTTTIYQSSFNPIWSKISKLSVSNEWNRIKTILNKLILLTFVIMLGSVLLISIFSSFYLDLLVGNQYDVTFELAFYIGLSFLCYMVFEATVVFQSAVNIIKLRFALQTAVILILNPLLVMLNKYYGYTFVPLSIALLWFVLFLILYYEANKIIYIKGKK